MPAVPRLLPEISARVPEEGQPFLRVRAPYHPSWPARAKRLGGTWHRPSYEWQFDPRDSDRVAAMCDDLFGYDWTTWRTVPVMTVRVTLPAEAFKGKDRLDLFGRLAVQRRYNQIELGPGVLLQGGRFLTPVEPLTLEVRDVPAVMVDRKRAHWESKGGTIEAIAHEPPRTLPAPPQHNALPLDASPDVQTILDAWARLDARAQDKLLTHLHGTLPGGR